jgi:hypothetical protein
MTLRLTRGHQQGVVVRKKEKSGNKPLVIRVLDIVPNSVGLGFDGDDYEVIRAEIFNTAKDSNYDPRNSK